MHYPPSQHHINSAGATHNPSFVLHEAGVVRYEDHAIPKLGSHDVLIYISYTGICGSDVHYWKHGRIGKYVLEEPMVLGHESSGVVKALGANVTTLSIGDRVAVEPGIPCRRCARCRGGKYNLCVDMRFAATPPVHGTLAKYYAAPEDFCHRLPDCVSLQEGALVEPLGVAVHIIRQAEVKPGQTVVVFGAGPVGLLCCAVARVFGASAIVCVDRSEARLQFARSYVATNVYAPRGQPAEECATDLLRACGLDEAGVDVAIDATGAEPCIKASVHVLRTGGTYVQAGMGSSEVAFPIGALCGKEITMKGSFRYQEGDYGLAVHMLASKQLSVRELITDVVAFEDAETAFQNVSLGKGIKTLIRGVSIVPVSREEGMTQG